MQHKSRQDAKFRENKTIAKISGFTLVLCCSIQIEGQLFSGDDTALNGVKLRCGDVKGHLVSDIESAEGDWGLWTEVISCNNHTGQNMSHDFIVAFQLQVERDQVKQLSRGMRFPTI